MNVSGMFPPLPLLFNYDELSRVRFTKNFMSNS
jgi:hypothetical protein